tara:strand:+ start:25470 stop:25586 length:117 start_codon:yes stop_codon:yes gene_type:complete
MEKNTLTQSLENQQQKKQSVNKTNKTSDKQVQEVVNFK